MDKRRSGERAGRALLLLCVCVHASVEVVRVGRNATRASVSCSRIVHEFESQASEAPWHEACSYPRNERPIEVRARQGNVATSYRRCPLAYEGRCAKGSRAICCECPCRAHDLITSRREAEGSEVRRKKAHTTTPPSKCEKPSRINRDSDPSPSRRDERSRGETARKEERDSPKETPRAQRSWRFALVAETDGPSPGVRLRSSRSLLRALPTLGVRARSSA